MTKTTEARRSGSGTERRTRSEKGIPRREPGTGQPSSRGEVRGIGMVGVGALLGAAAMLMAMGCDVDTRATEMAGLETCPSLPLAGATADGAAPLVVAPATLAETGLYCDSSRFTTAPGVRAFRPRYELWSDGADKSRFILLPAGTTIDATDLDHWQFPVGTRLWKEFKYQGRRIETRVISRFGAGPDDFMYATYLWNAAETDATLVSPEGLPDVAPLSADGSGPHHDVPAIADCKGCHERVPERILGIGALQSSHDQPGLTLGSLIDEGLIAPLPPRRAFSVPGDATAQAALGYLHANCSHCHNDTPSGVTFPRYMLRLHVGDATVESTDTYRTAVNVLHTWLGAPDGVGPYRIQGGDPENSELYYRAGVREPAEQMPPVGTKVVDSVGHALLRTWIASLPPPPAPLSRGSVTVATAP